MTNTRTCLSINPFNSRLAELYLSVILAPSVPLWHTEYIMHLTLHMPSWHTEYVKILKLRWNHWHTKCKTFFGLMDLSLLCSRFLGCHAMLPQRNSCSQPNHILFLLCLQFVCTLLNRPITIAKCAWRKISREKACSVNNEGFQAFVSSHTHVTKNGLCSQATIMTDKKKCEWKP